MLGYDESQIQYHENCNFTALESELVIVDEADCFMFNDPTGFKSFISKTCCLCFTATPDNQDPEGIEAKILNSLEFKRFHYSLDNETRYMKQSLEVDETLDIQALEDQL